MSKPSIPKLVKAETRVAHIKQLTIGDQIRMVGRSSSPPQSTASRTAMLRIVTGKTAMKGTAK
jgi:hypothetical protein